MIRLVEGIKGSQRESFEVSGTVLGPYFPVTIEPHSRCALVYFSNAYELFTFNESFDTDDPEFKAEEGSCVVRRVEASSFRIFASKSTTVVDLRNDSLLEHLVWCEDRVFQVLSSAEPEVSLTDSTPDFSIERGKTWSAS